MVTWCTLHIYDPQTSVIGSLQYVHMPLAFSSGHMCCKLPLSSILRLYIHGIHRITIIYILHIYVYMSVTLQECNYALPYAPICCCLPKWLLLTNGFTVPIFRSGTLQEIAQAPPYSIPTPKEYIWGSRSQHHLPPVCEGTAASNRLSVITLTSALAVYKQKLFYHIQAKGGAMFGNFILFTQPLLYLILLQWTFKLFNSSLSVHIYTVCM